MTAFIAIAAAALVAALGFVLPALWGRGSASVALDEQSRLKALYHGKLEELDSDVANDDLSAAQTQQSRRDLEHEMYAMIASTESSVDTRASRPWMKWAVALVVPVVAGASYFSFVVPVQQQVAAAAAQSVETSLPLNEDGTPSIPQMVEQLKARLAQTPNDIQGWSLLGRSMTVLGRYGEAAQAYERAVALSAFRDADLVVAYAESLAFAAGREIDNRVLSLLKDALKLDAEQPKALWLTGWAHFQREEYGQAVGYWETLDSLVKPDSELKKLVETHIAQARSAMEKSAGVLVANQAVSGAAVNPVADEAASLTVKVSLAPELKSQASPEDTVFVIARDVDGLRPPLALVRKQVKDLPFSVHLDDASAMIPSNKLSTAEEVRVTVRVSKSGQATARAGDLQGQIERVELSAAPTVDVQINSRLP